MSWHERLCGVMHQEQLLLVNLNKLFAEYKKKNSLDKIGFSKFCELGPKFVVRVPIHQNTELLTAAIPGGNHGN